MSLIEKSHPGFQRLLKDTRKIARDNGIKITISKSDFVVDTDSTSKSIGYFDSDGLEMACSNYNDSESFIKNFVHESCHMDQFLNDKFLWEKCSPGYTIFFEWLESSKIVKREILEEAVQDIIRLEKDCEMRSIAKIKKYKLPIDIDAYTRAANSYLYGYLFFLEKKKWIPAIYADLSVTNIASSKFAKSYDKIPKRLHAAFNRKLKTINKAS